MSFGNGWINYVENCRFSGNGIGLEIYASANAWDITDNCIEACDVGICASRSLASFTILLVLPALSAQRSARLRLDIADATAILIEGSIIESVGIPIFLGLGCQGVTITSSYCKHVP